MTTALEPKDKLDATAAHPEVQVAGGSVRPGPRTADVGGSHRVRSAQASWIRGSQEACTAIGACAGGWPRAKLTPRPARLRIFLNEAGGVAALKGAVWSGKSC
jgi:hypothetical protein